MTAIKDLKQGSPAKLSRLTKESRETRPPSRFTEVSLAKKLSDLGIGRPSTLSSIVSVIQDRGYVKRHGSQLYPAPLGFAIAHVLSAKFPDFTDYGYTAEMEEELERIEENSKTKLQFLVDFWRGKDGFEKLLEGLRQNVDYDEIGKLTTIDLHNGFEVKVNRYGAFLQDPKAEPNEKGYVPSAKLDDEADLWEYRDAAVCRELLENAVNAVGPRELGVLASGEYAGYTVFAKDGKFGPFLQAVHPDQLKAEAADKKPTAKTPKPVNQKLPEGVELDTVELKDVESLFAEVKLPRTLSPQLFVGIGKKGPWLGRKASAKAKRAVFVSIPEGFDPRTMSLEDAEKIWKDKQAAKK